MECLGHCEGLGGWEKKMVLTGWQEDKGRKNQCLQEPWAFAQTPISTMNLKQPRTSMSMADSFKTSSFG